MNKKITLMISAIALGIVPIFQALPVQAKSNQAVKKPKKSNVGNKPKRSSMVKTPNHVKEVQANQRSTHFDLEEVTERTQRTISMRATAYTAHPSENGKWGAVDALGNPLRLGTFAADPKVIKPGTSVCVTGYDNEDLPKGGLCGVASDTGGKIKGKKIDIFMPVSRNKARKFGVQPVTVYILN